MRILAVAAAVCLCLLPMAGGFAATPPALHGDAQGTEAAGTGTSGSGTPSAAKPAPPSPAAPPSNDAAAKHAKRTACLKTVKTNKLVGAEKTSFLKNCIAAP